MQERFKLIPEVHLLLIRDGKVLMLLRENTGYCDGMYSVVAGHLEGNESMRTAMSREIEEESGLIIPPEKLNFVHVMHRKSEQERVSFFFSPREWSGEPVNTEPDKCADLSWFPLDQLPQNTIPYIRFAIENYLNKIAYSEFNW